MIAMATDGLEKVEAVSESVGRVEGRRIYSLFFIWLERVWLPG